MHLRDLRGLRVLLAHQEVLDQLEVLGHLVQQDHQDQQVVQDQRDLLVVLVHLDHLVVLVYLVQQEHQDRMVLLVEHLFSLIISQIQLTLTLDLEILDLEV